MSSAQEPLQQARLLVSGDDRPGVVAAVSGILADEGANIVALDQYSSDPHGGRFFQRTVFELAGLQALRPQLEKRLNVELRDGLGQKWQLTEVAKRKRMAIFASKTDHCLLDLLWRQQRGDLNVEIAMVVSNHPDLAERVRAFDIPYFYVPVRDGDKKAAEAEHLRLVRENVDFIVLARYMQIISGEFIHGVAAR